VKKAYAIRMATGAIETKIGWIEISADGAALTHVEWRGMKPARLSSSPLIREAQRQLTLYFERRLTDFDLPINADGSAFAREVWTIMRAIPYGGTLTCGEVALRLQMPAQAVGQACGQNPIAIIIPCHRIVGTGKIGGYSSELGLEAKTFLLDLESGQQRLF
jgi:methylated-DNA-[protein]-cysteine S-methyltransferase